MARLILFHLCLALATPVTASAEEVIFDCSIGGKHLALTMKSDNVRYEFGPPGAPELTLEHPFASGKALWRYDLYNRSEGKFLIMSNGDVDYVVFNSWSAPTSLTSGSKNVSGVLVLEDKVEIARLFCDDPAEFSVDADMSVLPQASDDLSETIALIEAPDT